VPPFKKTWNLFMTDQNPINFERNSFASIDAAEDMCDLLRRETGHNYIVVNDNYLGFTPKKQEERQVINQSGTANINDFGQLIYRQSIKGFIPQYIEIAAGSLMIINPFVVIGWCFNALKIDTIPAWINISQWGEILHIFGFIVLVYGLRFIYSYFATTLCFESDGVVLKQGIIAQNQVQIRFGDIKTIGIQQSILNRLLGIGILRLDSAGTNGVVDIIFNNLVSPVQMRQRIQRLIDRHVQN
jgi:membrane protein YdbS with pleckstrin-like domain